MRRNRDTKGPSETSGDQRTWRQRQKQGGCTWRGWFPLNARRGEPQILGREVPTGWDEDSGICWQSLWEAEGVPLGCDSDSVHSAATQPCIKSNKNSTLTAPPLMNLSSIPVFCHRCYFCVALSGVCNTRSNRRENKDTCSKEDYLNHILGEISPAYVYAAYHVTQKCQEFHRIH